MTELYQNLSWLWCPPGRHIANDGLNVRSASPSEQWMKEVSRAHPYRDPSARYRSQAPVWHWQLFGGLPHGAPALLQNGGGKGIGGGAPGGGCAVAGAADVGGGGAVCRHDLSNSGAAWQNEL